MRRRQQSGLPSRSQIRAKAFRVVTITRDLESELKHEKRHRVCQSSFVCVATGLLARRAGACCVDHCQSTQPHAKTGIYFTNRLQSVGASCEAPRGRVLTPWQCKTGHRLQQPYPTFVRLSMPRVRSGKDRHVLGMLCQLKCKMRQTHLQKAWEFPLVLVYATSGYRPRRALVSTLRYQPMILCPEWMKIR
jgi:hypothetical protein